MTPYVIPHQTDDELDALARDVVTGVTFITNDPDTVNNSFMTILAFIEFAPAEVFESPLRRELQNAGFPVINGAIALPECAGIGYQLPPDILDRFRI